MKRKPDNLNVLGFLLLYLSFAQFSTEKLLAVTIEFNCYGSQIKYHSESEWLSVMLTKHLEQDQYLTCRSIFVIKQINPR